MVAVEDGFFKVEAKELYPWSPSINQYDDDSEDELSVGIKGEEFDHDEMLDLDDVHGQKEGVDDVLDSVFLSGDDLTVVMVCVVVVQDRACHNLKVFRRLETSLNS
ncbi:hypothetical protein L1987_05154 [Smallanthus sonchifolius]|uniref:Uncharacterized protein n=1 Tax=Smallanthus sonchifolius TaxID=185202 RepID=A0ACB9JUX2_9ASTR|nr:hypothetical protein L1987_05154 [Smallanthus sonchifolius]